MSSIDERVVQMQFDNAQFEEGIQTSLKSIDALKKGLKFNHAEEGLEEIQKSADKFSMSNLAQNIETISSKFSVMGIMATRVLQNIADEAYYAGKRLIRSLSIDQISAGMGKYEMMTKATQTIKSATGKNIEEIEGYLADLNKYTDETSYSFSDMVDNIGKFTANGVNLADAVEAMKGIANEAALSGVGINGASRAMYNFSQALATGKVQLIDWKSIENANMATKEFKEEIIQTAKGLGKLKEGNKTLKGTAVTFENFSSTLSEGWFTSDVLIEVLKHYADTTTELGDKAFKAAQQATTFTDALEAVKDAVGSGWMRTFNIVFGNLDESIELWTNLCNAVIEMIDPIQSTRNELLQGWKDLGGRTTLIESLATIFKSLYVVVIALGEAMRDVFPETTADDLMAITNQVKEFSKWIEKVTGKEVFDGYIATEKEITSNAEILSEAITKGMTGDKVKKMQELLAKAGYDIGSSGADGIFGPKTEEALKKFKKDVGLTIDGIYDGDTQTKLLAKLGITPETKTEIETEAKYVYKFSDALKEIQRIGRGAFAILHIGAQVLKVLFNSAKNIAGTFTPVISSFIQIGAVLGDCFVALDKFLEKTGILNLIGVAIESWVNPLATKMQSFANTILFFFGVIDKSGKVIDYASKGGATFTKVLENMRKAISSTEIGRKFLKSWSKFALTIKDVTPKVKEFFKTLINFGKNGQIAKGFKSIGDKINSLAISAVNFLSNSLDWISDKIKGVPEYLNKAKEFFSGVLSFAKPFFDKVPEYKDKLKMFFEALKSQTPEKLKSAGAKIKVFFTDVYEGLKNNEKVQNAIEKAKEVWKYLSEFVEKVIANVDDWAKNLNIRSSIEDVIKFIADRVQKVNVTGKLLGGLLDNVNGIFDNVETFFSGVGKGIGKILGNVFSGNTILALLGVGVVAFITKTLKLVDDVTSGFKELSKGFTIMQKNKQDSKNISNSFLEIAASIAIIAGAIYFIGNMDASALSRGATVVSVIFAAVTSLIIGLKIMNKVSGRAGDIGKVGKMLIGMAAMIGVITASMYVFSKMDVESVIKGITTMTVILVEMLVFIKIFSKISSSVSGSGIKAKSFLGLVAALGIMSLLVVLLSKMDFDTALKGSAALLAMSGMLVLIVGVISKISSNVQFKGLFSLAAAIGLLSGIVYLLGKMPLDIAIRGIAVASAIMLILGILVTAISKSGLNSEVKIGSILLLSLAIGILSGIVIVLGMIPIEAAIRGIASLVAMSVSMKLLFSSLGKIKISDALITMVVLLEVAGLMYAVVKALDSIKDVDSKVIISFTAGIGILLAGVGAFMALAGVAGFQGVLVGVVALAAFIAAMAGVIALVNAFPSDVESAFTTLGKAIGSFAGAFQAAQMKQLSEGMKEIGETEIDEAGIQNAINCMGLINQFSESLPHKGAMQKISDLFLGSDMQSFSHDLAYFGQGISSFSSSLSGADIDTELTQKAVEAATMVNSLASTIGGMTIEEGIANKINGGSAFATFCGELSTFAICIRTANAVLSGNEIDSAAFSNAATAATYVQKLASTIDGLTIGEAIANKINGSSAFTSFCGEIRTFAKSIRVANAVLKNGKEIDGDAFSNAATAATYVQKLASSIGSISIGESIANLIAGGGPFETFCKDIGTFATSMVSASDTLKSLSETTIETDVTTAVNAATAMANFIGELDEIEIPTVKGGFMEWMTGKDEASSFFAHIAKLGEAITEIQNGSINGLAKSSIVSDINSLKYVISSFVGMIDGVDKNLSEIDANGFDMTQRKIDAFGDLLYAIKEDLSKSIGSISFEGSGLESLAEICKSFNIIVDGSSLDSSNMTTNLDSAAVIKAVQEFTTSVTSQLEASSTALQNHQENYMNAGEDAVSQLSSGLKDDGQVSGSATEIVSGAASAAMTAAGGFKDVGIYCVKGLAQGMKTSAALAKIAAMAVVMQAISAARKAGEINSPSRKFAEIGMYLDLGLVKGMEDYSGEVKKSSNGVMKDALNTVRTSIARASDLINDGFNTDPVVRPVVDLSNVSAGARTISGMLSNQGSIGMTASVSASMAGSAAIKSGQNQNGSSSGSSSVHNNTSSVNLSGNNFYIRSEQDIHNLANEIATVANQQKRALGGA